jgi:hypothetical protein
MNPGPHDDGWWIDDVRIDETLSSPAVLYADEDVLHHCAGDDTVGCLTDQDCVDAGTTGPCEGEAPQCGPTCTGITVLVATEPDDTGGVLDEVLEAPGAPIWLDASASHGTCLDGTLQFRFSKDGGATVLGEWSEWAAYYHAPQADTDYLVEVRCSTDTDCGSSAVVDVDVACPSSGNLGEVFPAIAASTPTTWSWSPAKEYMLHKGDLPVTGAYAGAQTEASGTSFSDATQPISGGGFYYLLREVGQYCNDQGLWSSGGPSEQEGRDTTLP